MPFVAVVVVAVDTVGHIFVAGLNAEVLFVVAACGGRLSGFLVAPHKSKNTATNGISDN